MLESLAIRGRPQIDVLPLSAQACAPHPSSTLQRPGRAVGSAIQLPSGAATLGQAPCQGVLRDLIRQPVAEAEALD